MKTNPLILKRFEELEAQIHQVNATKSDSGFGSDVLSDSKPFEEWATGVLNLLQHVFSESSIYFSFQKFLKALSNF